MFLVHNALVLENMNFQPALCTLFIIFATCAYICFQKPTQLENIRNWLLYTKYSTLILFGTASGILLYKIFHLSIADFGEYKNLLLILFSTICVISFWTVKELLSIRGLAILVLFFCDSILDALYTQISLINNIFTGIIYAIIIFAIFIGSAPYLMRDWLDYLIEHHKVQQFTGYALSICAILTLLVIF